MRKIEVIMHYPNQGSSTHYITKVATEAYLKTVMKILDNSSLTYSEKKELLSKIIDQELLKDIKDNYDT